MASGPSSILANGIIDGCRCCTRPRSPGNTSSLSSLLSFQPALSDRHASHHQELVATLFELGREVTSVLDLDELRRRIPRLIARLTDFTVFAVYLLDDKQETLHIAYAEGYPDEVVRTFRLKVGEGIVGTAVAEQRPILVNDVNDDARFRGLVAGVK